MTRDELIVGTFVVAGRAMALGLNVTAPRLPRSPATQALLELEATRDPAVQRALAASIAEAEAARRLPPQTIRRLASGPIVIR